MITNSLIYLTWAANSPSMRKMGFLLLFTLSLIVSYSQDKTLPAEAKSFVPKGYEMLDYVTGDLNNDKRPDAILVLNKPGEDTVYEEELHRPMLLLIRQTDGKLKQVFRNDNAILCHHCGGVFGDPYEGITIKPGSFEISFYGGSSWRWSSGYLFNYNMVKKNWYLNKEKQVSFHAGDPEKTTKEYTITPAELGEVSFTGLKSQPVFADSRWKVKAEITNFYDNPDLKSKPRKGYLLKGNVLVGTRHLKNFIQGSFDDGKGNITEGFILRRDLQEMK